MAASQQLQVRLPPELHQRAKDEAARRGLSINAMVILALEHMLGVVKKGTELGDGR